MKPRVEALILDLDGVVLWRPGYQTKATSDYKKEGVGIYTPPPRILDLNQEIIRGKLSFKDHASFVWHHMRFVYPDVAKAIQQVEGVDIFGNTGRFDHGVWRWMTETYLRMGGIPEGTFQEIHYRPKGIGTIDSKIAYVGDRLKRYNRVRVVDDNPADLLPILNQFGDRVEGVLMEDWSTDFLLADIKGEEYPNLRVAKRFREGVQDLIPRAA